MIAFRGSRLEQSKTNVRKEVSLVLPKNLLCFNFEIPLMEEEKGCDFSFEFEFEFIYIP
jgi:hypothetical protein